MQAQAGLPRCGLCGTSGQEQSHSGQHKAPKGTCKRSQVLSPLSRTASGIRKSRTSKHWTPSARGRLFPCGGESGGQGKRGYTHTGGSCPGVVPLRCIHDPASRTRAGARPSPPGLRALPHIVPLSSKTLSSVLPSSGTGDQVLLTLGGVDAWMRRLGISLVGAFALYNLSVVLTALISLYWVWSPILDAARTNLTLRLKYKYAGVWKTRILEAQEGPFQAQEGARWSAQGPQTGYGVHENKYKLLVGDAGGVTIEVLLPLSAGRPVLHAGEAAEVLVLSDRPNCSRFRAVRDVYLPRRQLWLSQELVLEHAVFEDISSRLPDSRPAGDAPLEDDLDSMYSARVFELDLDPRQGDAHQHPTDRYDGEHLVDFSDGTESFGGSESNLTSNLTEDWLGAERDLLQEGFWER